MFISEYIHLLIFYSSYLWFSSFSQSILPIYYYSRGLSISQLVLSMLFMFIGQMAILLIVRKFHSKVAWVLAVFSSLAYILLSINVSSIGRLLLAYSILGFSIYFFSLFYNVAHFSLSRKENVGKSSAIMYSLPMLIGVFAPVVAGFLAQLNMLFVWSFSFVFFLLPLILIRHQKDFVLNYEIRETLAKLKGVKTFIFLEGVWEALVFAVIPIYTLTFIKTPINYGAYLAYLSLVSIFANQLLGGWSDKIQKRSMFLYPVTIILGITTLLFPLTLRSILFWIIVTGIVKFILPVFWNLTTVLVVDNYPDIKAIMPGREILLAFGRIVGLLATFAGASLDGGLNLVFVFLGISMLSIPTLLFWRTRISRSYRFL